MKQEPWENQFVQISHALIKELVDQPYMITGVEENFYGQGKAVINQCFYVTVVYLEKSVLVFHNEAGGMCPIDADYFHKKYSSIETLGLNFHEMYEDLKKQSQSNT